MITVVVEEINTNISANVPGVGGGSVNVGVGSIIGPQGPEGPQGPPSLDIFYHNADENALRPDYPIVHWFGTVEPINAINGDIWFDIT